MANVAPSGHGRFKDSFARISASEGQQYAARLNWSPGCFLSQTADPAIASGVITAFIWNQAVYDNNNFFNANQDFISVNSGGIYSVVANIEFAGSATGLRALYIYHRFGGVDTLRAAQMSPGNAAGNLLNASCILSCNSGESVKVKVFQNSGGGLDVHGGLTYSPVVWIQRLAPTKTSKE